MLEVVVGKFVDSRVDEVVVVLGHEADRIRAQSDFGRAKVVVNADYAEGMGSSIRAGMDAMDKDARAVIIALGDQPLLRTETIDALLEEYAKSGGPIVAPFFRRRRGNPVLFDRSLFRELKAAKGDSGAKATIERLRDSIVRVQVDDSGVVLDVDTKEDYRRLRGRLEG